MTAATLDARRFRALQQDWSSEDLARFFLLATEDMREVRTCRGASNRFGFEVEITARLAQARARIWEIPISYSGRTYAEGKKITWRDGFAALFHILRYNVFVPRNAHVWRLPAK